MTRQQGIVRLLACLTASGNLLWIILLTSIHWKWVLASVTELNTSTASNAKVSAITRFSNSMHSNHLQPYNLSVPPSSFYESHIPRALSSRHQIVARGISRDSKHELAEINSTSPFSRPLTYKREIISYSHTHVQQQQKKALISKSIDLLPVIPLDETDNNAKVEHVISAPGIIVRASLDNADYLHNPSALHSRGLSTKQADAKAESTYSSGEGGALAGSGGAAQASSRLTGMMRTQEMLPILRNDIRLAFENASKERKKIGKNASGMPMLKGLKPSKEKFRSFVDFLESISSENNELSRLGIYSSGFSPLKYRVKRESGRKNSTAGVISANETEVTMAQNSGEGNITYTDGELNSFEATNVNRSDALAEEKASEDAIASSVERSVKDGIVTMTPESVASIIINAARTEDLQSTASNTHQKGTASENSSISKQIFGKLNGNFSTDFTVFSSSEAPPTTIVNGKDTSTDSSSHNKGRTEPSTLAFTKPSSKKENSTADNNASLSDKHEVNMTPHNVWEVKSDSVRRPTSTNQMATHFSTSPGPGTDNRSDQINSSPIASTASAITDNSNTSAAPWPSSDIGASMEKSSSSVKNTDTYTSPEPDTEPESSPEPEITVETENQPDEDRSRGPKEEPEGETQVEPEGEPEGEPGVEPKDAQGNFRFPSPEPGPEWDEAKQKWGLGWEIHIFGLGGAFGAVGVYILLSLIRLWRIQRLLSRGYFLSLNLLMLGLCATRAFYLLYDSYNSEDTFPISVNYFLYSIAFPCLSAAFSVLLYALLKATNMQLVSPSVQRLPVLLFIIVIHFGLSLASDLLVGHFAGARILLFVCQIYYVMWGLFLFVGYAYIFRKLYAHAVKRQKNVIYSSTSTSLTFPSGSNGSLNFCKVRSRYTLSAAVKVTFFTALCGLVTIGLELYAIGGVYNTFTWKTPEPWPWFVYHTVLRVLELLMCLTMSYVASQPFRYRRPDRSCCTCGILCVPCSEILCCGSRITSSDPMKQHQHPNSAASCSWSDLDLAPTKLHSTRLRSPGDRNQLQGYSSPGSKNQRNISSPTPSPGSLLIVEDGYVRFQTDHDINRIVDAKSPASFGLRGEDVHSANTLPLRDGCLNSGYAKQGDESKFIEGVGDQLDSNLGFTWDDDKSRKSSLAGSGFFRINSSVSLADSIENELERAFVTFRMDGSNEVKTRPGEEEEVAETEEDNNFLDIAGVSELPNMKETDLISVDSLAGSDDAIQQDLDYRADRNDQQYCSSSLPRAKQPHNSAFAHSPRRSFTLLRRAKSSEINETKGIPSHAAWTQMLKRSFSDHTSRPLPSESSSVRYTHLLDMDSTDSKLSDHGIYSTDEVFLKQPSADNWNCSVTENSRKSLLQSSAINNDNIEV
ncbi:proline-rich transmembrane protein 4-like [Plakobranchus ocellatus]|uniref:Proline-rich transmembrane protein 4-like n=1 Tax=Plakobranchus ocellatus TaxID=259542 RepID=A0AAV4D8H2_9GAST|nr:proline-rich transmembrane protein 4-like [Plakobranchus ocellatus]